ncbi:MAG: sugar ABC transporter permease [Sphaerochaetaceae bacterium]|nr:sugar ABC transporter permease [Sphaerochaetaceae bacterium]MDC7249819.1 sugar ABC transporter permease [Sphaerochaetaceae bacterium]
MKNRNDAVMGYLYILPSFILICVFAIIPIFMNVYYSFTQFNVIQSAQWIGLENYSRMLKDPYIVASLKNTFVFTLITVPLQSILALLLAAVLAGQFRNKMGEAIKSAMFIPVIASAVLVGTLWSIFLEPNGLMNTILSFFHIPTINWLGGKTSSLLSVSMATVWKNVGYFLVIYYAGIMDIPKELYEASQVDGASKIQQFFHITVPSLSSVTYLIVTLGTIWSFQIFDMVFTMTNGGPGMSTVTLVLTIYNAAFKSFNMGYAASIALVMFVIVIVLQALQRKFLGEGRDDK